IEKYNIPFALGWGSIVNDNEAIIAAKFIYFELSRGKNLLESVWRARYELLKKAHIDMSSGWILLRLLGDMTPMVPFVKEKQKKKPKQMRLKHIELKNSHVKVLEEGFVGRRRPLQKSLNAIKKKQDKMGVLILGAGGLGKSCLAGKICDRFRLHNLIIVHGELNSLSLEKALQEGFIIARDRNGMQIIEEKIELAKKLDKLCVEVFNDKNYLILLDDFEQNLEGYEKGEIDQLKLEAAQLMKVLFHRLPMGVKMTQLIITSRYQFSLEEKEIDLVSERLELVYLTRFLPAEQKKKVMELEFISKYPNDAIRKRLVAAGYGNPRLMEWLDLLVKEMGTCEVVELMKKIDGKKEEFIRKHVLRKLLRKGGKDFNRLISWMSIYRRPILKEGVNVIGEKAKLLEWEKLLKKGVQNSVVEFYQTDESYEVISILRKEMLNQIGDFIGCHRTAFDYYLSLKEKKKVEKVYDPFLGEELIYHALRCGEEDIASGEGAVLVHYLQDNLAYVESKCLGEWILKEKKKALFTGNDAILLNNLGYLVSTMGDQPKAIEYYEQALYIDQRLYGKRHKDVAIDLNNLGSAYDELGEKERAINYYNQALTIVKNIYGGFHPYIAGTLNNLGSAYDDLGEKQKAIMCYEEALAID
ncbi:MAG TPA: tetratricopeptide repeat protein, partial [Candidatus Kapabacteria bacterium]|nr:tetratricopeptide repeat protein [Candidatus Kapabacteria bacterium]